MNVIFLFVTLIVSVACSPETYEVPQQDGSVKNMTEAEIDAETAKGSIFDPHRDMAYHLYTRLNPVESQVLAINDTEALRNSNFNPELRTIVGVHGYEANYTDESIQLPKEEYLKKGDYNFIGVDWGIGANEFYTTSRYHVKKVGSALAELLQFLVSEGANPEKIFLYGFSLGGHVVGNAGRAFEVKVGQKLPAILSLDPAGPFFTCWVDKDCVNSNDARYVQIVHTYGKLLGYFKPRGHADFYVHGGKEQNGCTGVCSHLRAFQYLTESINGGKFIATKCMNLDQMNKDGCEFLGEKVDVFEEPLTFKEGIYYVDTAAESPFAMN